MATQPKFETNRARRERYAKFNLISNLNPFNYKTLMLILMPLTNKFEFDA